MPHNQVKPGSVRIQLVLTQEADNLLRDHARKHGKLSEIVDTLIKKEYAKKTDA